MQERKRFYIDTHGIDNNAFARIIQKAIELENQLKNVSRIVFITHRLHNDGWLKRQFGNNITKSLIEGTQLPNSNVIAKHESLNSYYKSDNEILITLGLKSDDILLLDDHYNINAVIALPSTKKSINKWTQITNATNIDTNMIATSFPNPPCVVIKALEELTKEINMSTGLSNSSDNKLAKTYLRTLVKYEIPLFEDIIESYLIKELNWTKRHSNELLEIINKINNDRSFHGGEKTGLKSNINRWKKECEE